MRKPHSAADATQGRPMQRFALCLEQTLGHRAHSKNLEIGALKMTTPLDIFRIEYPSRKRLPIPWALRSSVAAHRMLRSSSRRYGVVFYHTQSVSLLALWLTGRSPYVVSVDATPSQMDELGLWYNHGKTHRTLEALKKRWYQRIYRRSSAIVAWSQWAADSLVSDYGADRSRILVAHPGAMGAFFAIPRDEPRIRPTILFVGGDWQRKGGPSLLKAFARVSDRADLLIVSNADIELPIGARQVRGIRPGTAELVSAFAESEIFCLPTLGDCTSVAIGEALAAGLPVITTKVGSNAETIEDGRTGLLVEAGNDEALAEALERLVYDAEERTSMSLAAREDARGRFDAERNAGRLFRLLEHVSS